MLRLETTRACPRTPVVLFLLEELGEPCELVTREPGHFQAEHQAAGPMLVDGDLELLGFDTILRHLARTRGSGALLSSEPRELALVDRWMEMQGTTLRPAIARLAAVPAAPPPDAIEALRGALAVLDRALAGQEHLCGRFTVADAPAVAFARLARFGFDLAGLPHLAGYVERVTARPAWRRAQERLDAEGVTR